MTEDPATLALLADHGNKAAPADPEAYHRTCGACATDVTVAADLDGTAHRLVNLTDPTVTLLEPAATGWRITQTRLAVITTCPGPPR